MNTKKVYYAIAKKIRVSVAEVKCEINAALDELYKNPNSTTLEVSRKGVQAHAGGIYLANGAECTGLTIGKNINQTLTYRLNTRKNVKTMNM